MKVTSSQAEKILKSDNKFSQLGFALLVSRLRNAYSKDKSPTTVQHAVQEINKFLEKFTNIMAADFAVIQKL